MSKIKHIDMAEALEVLDKALQIQLNISKGNLIEIFLGRLYDEKGHLLTLLAINQEGKAL